MAKTATAASTITATGARRRSVRGSAGCGMWVRPCSRGMTVAWNGRHGGSGRTRRRYTCFWDGGMASPRFDAARNLPRPPVRSEKFHMRPADTRVAGTGARRRGGIALTEPQRLPYKPPDFKIAAEGRVRSPSVSPTEYPVRTNAIERRRPREADLSTEQAGAQAPSRLPCPHGDQGRAQGGGRPAGARTQTAQRLICHTEVFNGPSEATGRVSRRCSGNADPRPHLRAPGAPARRRRPRPRRLHGFPQGRHRGRAQPAAPAAAGGGAAFGLASHAVRP